MIRFIQHTLIIALVGSISFSQVGVLLYDVYCHCKKESSSHLHMAFSACEDEQASFSMSTSCCSTQKSCSNAPAGEPCEKKEITFLQLDLAKEIIKKSEFRLDDFLFVKVFSPIYLAQNILSSKLSNSSQIDFELNCHPIRRHTQAFIQQYLC
jgi:hypothetical protein